MYENHYEHQTRAGSLQGGPRVSPLRGHVRPYAEVLMGIDRWTFRSRQGSEGFWFSDSEGGFSFQPGLGVDLMFGRRVGVRVGGCVRFTHHVVNARSGETELEGEYRATAGVIYSWGRR